MSSRKRTDPALPKPSPARDRRLVRRLAAWFDRHARPLPWRDAPPGERDPYQVLVSELMLQQTQVSRVAERFPRFLARFPTLRALAEADEAEVLAEWSGMGYYRRARLLHSAARAAAAHHAGNLPSAAADLRAMPGIGRYTAGAIASLAHGRPEPAVDGNAVRVLARLEAREGRTGESCLDRWAWSRAEALVDAASREGLAAGGLNEAIMELGATVCTPRNPSCDVCPLAADCAGRASGVAASIPAPRRRAAKRPLYCLSLRATDARGRLLVERRGEGGLWASMWQAPTIERSDRAPTPREARTRLGVGSLEAAETFTHETTHRTVHFRVFEVRDPPSRLGPDAGCSWRTRAQVRALALSTPQRRILLGRD